MPEKIHVFAADAGPPEAVHALLADASTWPRWSPIDRATVERPGHGGVVHEVRRFETGRVASREEVVESIPSSRFSYVLLSGLPLRDYRADVDIESTSDGSVVHWRSSFRPVWPGSGWLYRLILKRFLQRMVDGLAIASRRHGGGHGLSRDAAGSGLQPGTGTGP